MSAKVRRKAIKDATVSGVFRAGAYAGNLVVKELERQVQAANSGGGGKPLYSPAKQDHDKNLASEENKPWVKDWHRSGIPLWDMSGSRVDSPTPTVTAMPPQFKVAQSAMAIFNSKDKYYVWGDPNKGEEVGWSPNIWGEEGIPESFGPYNNLANVLSGRIPVVCADVVLHAYKNAGYDLYADISKWALNSHPEYNNQAARNSAVMRTYLSEQGNLHYWGNGVVPEAGDIIISASGGHAGVVQSVQGVTPNDIYIVQASYSQYEITRITLQQFHDGTDGQTFPIDEISFGHPDILDEELP